MYSTQATMAENRELRARVAQSAAQNGCLQDGLDADTWAYEWRREWSSAPGWDAAWESAEESDNPDPGTDPTVITDGMIESQVQAMMPFRRVGEAAS